MLTLRNRLSTLLPAALLVIGLGACSDDDPLGPEDVEREDLVGTFEATTFTVTQQGVAVNLLAVGADVEISLRADGTTAGRLFLPQADDDGSDLDESLAGTYTFDEGTRRVVFDQAADTFLRDLTLTAVRTSRGIALEGTEDFGDGMVEIVLTRR